MTGNRWAALDEPQREAFGVRVLERALADFDGCTQRFNRWTVDPTSRLAEDNAATGAYRPMTHELHYLLTSAIDHLDAVAAAVRVENRLRPLAPFSLIRSAIESCAFVLWLQNAGTLDKRVLRLLQLQWQNRVSVDAYTIAAGTHSRPNTEHLGALLDQMKAARRGLNQRDYRMPMASTTDVLIETDKSFRLPLPHTGLSTWRACSGVTHGNVLFSSGLTDSRTVSPPGQGGATKLRTPQVAALALMLEPAVKYLDQAVGRIELHGQPRPGRPAPPQRFA